MKMLINNDRVYVIDHTLIQGDQAPDRTTNGYPFVDVLLAGEIVVINYTDGNMAQLSAHTNSV